MEHAGVGLPASERQEFNDIQQELATLSTTVNNNVLDSTKKFRLTFTNKDELELPVINNRVDRTYESHLHFLFEPLRSKERINILKAIIDMEYDLDVFVRSGIMTDYFPSNSSSRSSTALSSTTSVQSNGRLTTAEESALLSHTNRVNMPDGPMSRRGRALMYRNYRRVKWNWLPDFCT